MLSLLKRKKILFIFLVVCATTAVSVMHFWLPIYEARTSLAFQTANSSLLQAVSNKFSAFSIQEDEMREMERYVARLNTPDFFMKVAQELKAGDNDLDMFHKEMLSSKRRVLWNLGKLLHLSVPESTIKDLSDDEVAQILGKYVYFSVMGVDRIAVVVRSGDSLSSARVANIVAAKAAQLLLADGLKDLEDAHSYLERQAKDSEKMIRETEASLAAIKVNRGIVGTESGAGGDAGQGTEIQRQLTEAKLEVDHNNRRISQLRDELEAERKRDPSAANARLETTNRYGLPKRIAEIERTNAALDLKQLALRKLLSEMVSGSQNYEQKIFELRKRIEFEYSIYEELKKQAFQLEMKSIGARNKVQVGSIVRDNGASRSDNLPMKLAIALILSIFSGIPVALVWDMARPGVRSGRDLADAGLAYLGGVPLVSGRFSMEKKAHGPRICRFDSDSEVAMSFIQVRSRLLHLSDRSEARSQAIAVISANAGEGKSFFSRSLAACFGHMGRKTLLIDCDLRKAVTTEYFDLTETAGIGEILAGERKFGDVVQRQVVKGVDFVGAGIIKTNITDLFADGAMNNLMRDLREIYDHIILDTPSLLAVPDAPMIARASDLPLLLASMNTTTQHDLEVSLDRIHALYSGEVYSVLNRVTGGHVPLYLVTGSRRSGSGTSNIFGAPQQGGGGAEL